MLGNISKTFLVVFALVCFATTSFAASEADKKKIWGGGAKKDSTYSRVYVPNTIKVLEGLRMSGYTWAGPANAGTINNAKNVTLNPTHIAHGQNDVLARLQGQPIPGMDGQNYDFKIVQDNAGPEMLFLIIDNKNYSNWGHILGNAWDLTCVTGGTGSGHYGTWMNLVERYSDDLADMPIEHVNGSSAMIEAITGNPTKFAFFVMRPDPKAKIFKKIAKAGLTMVPVVDFDIEDLYEVLTLKISSGWGGAQYHTSSATSVAIFTGNPEKVENKRDRKRLEATIERLSSVDAEAVKPRIGSFMDMWDSLVATAGDARKKLMEEAKAAKEKLENKNG